MMRSGCSAALAGVLMATWTATAGAAVRYVDDDAAPGGDGLSWARAYDALSTALTAAQGGDQVWVAAGTYVGNFTLALEVDVYGGFAGTETQLLQRDWTANPTILDGDANGSVVTAPAGAIATTRIDGFTITNGQARDGGGVYLERCSPTIANNRITGNGAGNGGGLFLWRSSPTITNSTITGNGARSYGGGLYLYRSSPAIANNTITSNGAGDSGGGLSLYSSHPTISNNTITDNTSEAMGGGLYLWWSSPTIADNTINGNSAYLVGGALYLESSSPTIVHNTITGNSAHYSGGGVHLDRSFPTIANNTIVGNNSGLGSGLYLRDSSPTIVNNTITYNYAGADGGGLYLCNESSPTIANTLIAFNSSGIFLDEHGSIAMLRYSCVFGNTAYDYSGLADPTGSDGNISADPRFIREPDDGGDGWGDDPTTPDEDEGANDDFGDLQLQLGSPGIDAGDNAAVPTDMPDMDGDGDTSEPLPFDLGGWPRFVDDPDTPDTGDPGELGPPVVDMGAHEYQPPMVVPLDIMPQSCPNRLPLKARGMIRIALLGTDLFDVSNVDLDSVLLTRADGVGGSIGPRLRPPGLAPKVRDVATPFEGELCDCHHHGQDGVDDLLLIFSGGALIRTLELDSVPGETPIELTLSGTLRDGTTFEASDCVQIAHPGSPPTAPAPKRDGRSRRP